MNPISLMADAEKLSIGQLQQAVKNGTVPAYIGIPMMQEKIKQSKQAQTPQAPTEPPIAQQVMAQASGIDQVPSNLPTQAMNDGGIVAFATGGIQDEEDDDYEEYQLAQEEAEHQDVLGRFIKDLQSQEHGRPSRSGNVNSTPRVNQEFALSKEATDAGLSLGQNTNIRPEDRAAALNRTGAFAPTQATPQAAPQGSPQGGIKSIVESAANRYNLPPELLYRLTGAESGYDPNARNKLSGASGLFQFLPATWQGMGGKPGEESDPTKNADLGAKFVRQNTEILKRELGRDPTYGEVYASHHFGAGVIPMLKNAKPNESIEAGLSMFESPSRVKLIMEQNPHLRGKTVGQVMASLNQKMGEGVVSGANGGITRLNSGGVARFNGQYGSLSGEERDKYIAGLGKPKEEAASPAGRFFSEIFDETPEQKNKRITRENAQRDFDRVNQQFGPKVGATGAFKAQTDQEYENAQNAISQANRNLNAARAGRGYAPPDIHGNYQPEVRNLQTPSQGRMSPEYEPSIPPIPKGAVGNGMPDYEPSQTSSVGNTNTASSSSSNVGGTKERSAYDEFMDYFKKGHEDLKAQKQEDKYMAILQAGLGMMAGTSPNALANIGQGASAGVAHYGASAKQRAAEQKDLLKGEITARRYQEMGEDRRSAQRIAEARYKDALDYRGEKDNADLEEKKYRRLQDEQVKNSQLYSLAETRLRAGVDKAYPMGAMSPPINGVKYEDAIASIQNNPQLNEIRRKAFPELDRISGFPTYDPAKKAYK
jgi:soluble lytic murein transglycosylase-like protein